jgi:DNA-binding winged helix-turn-helix (wHTH) protein/class 3 adenylate cyclase
MPYSFGVYWFDPARYELTRVGRPVPLRPKGCELLAYLLIHRDRLVPKEELLAQVWPEQYVGDAVLHTCILAVRKALHDAGRTPSLVHTVRGRGYRFVAPVEEQAQVPAAEPPLEGHPPAGVSVWEPSPPSLAAADPTGVRTLRAHGEYKHVTVLCCGLADAPALAAQLGPEGMYRLLQTLAGRTQEVLHRYDGTLLPPTSEGVTAVFGAPRAQEDHARCAVLAALDLQQHLRQPQTLRPPALGVGLAVQMGVHSGLVVVGETRPAAHGQVTVVGAPTQVALRLQQQASSGTLLVSAATYDLVREEVRGEPCGSVALDGQGLVQRRTGVPQRATQVRSPFVGRQRELALLHDRLEAVWTGDGQAVSLVGPPGIGKTRLLTEFARSLSPGQVTWSLGQCLAYSQAMPYLPVRDVVQQVCALDAGDPLETRTAAVRRWLAALGEVAEEDVAMVCHLLDLPAAPELLARLTPETRQARTFILLGHLIRHAAQCQPLVLAVENVHWIDPTSASWLGFLVERLAGMAVLLLVTARPGYQSPWGHTRRVTQLALPPLRTADSQVIVAAVPGAAQLPAARCQQIVTHGAGNPFFVEELAWHAVEHGRTTTPVPETVHAVLAARIDRLPAEAKDLLQTAAVIGPEVPVSLLQAIAEGPEAALLPTLTQLQAAAFLYETRLFPEPVYTFKHALTHEVAYEGLLQERRRMLHTRIVASLEELAGDRVAAQVEQLAHHAVRGELWDKALTYGQQAGEKAMAQSAHHEAVAYFEQALRALPPPCRCSRRR